MGASAPAGLSRSRATISLCLAKPFAHGERPAQRDPEVVATPSRSCNLIDDIRVRPSLPDTPSETAALRDFSPIFVRFGATADKTSSGSPVRSPKADKLQTVRFVRFVP